MSVHKANTSTLFFFFAAALFKKVLALIARFTSTPANAKEFHLNLPSKKGYLSS
jgi:hypothetical protein